MKQISVRLSHQTVDQLDAMVESGSFQSRAAAVRAGIEGLLDTTERSRVGREIADGYRRVPPTAEEDKAAMASTDGSISDEPW
jgi:Arc/MetJ-type ribon-helix-helix transcriptional regulator